MPLPMEIWRMLAGADTCEADFPRCDFNTAKSLPPTRCFAPSCSAAALPIALARQQKTRSPARTRSNAPIDTYESDDFPDNAVGE